MSFNCKVIKMVFLILVLLLVFFSYENTKVIKKNYQEVKQISEILNNLISQPYIDETP